MIDRPITLPNSPQLNKGKASRKNWDMPKSHKSYHHTLLEDITLLQSKSTERRLTPYPSCTLFWMKSFKQPNPYKISHQQNCTLYIKLSRLIHMVVSRYIGSMLMGNSRV